ncbi:phage portal protein family protein, partial [Elizabethkingia miricola]
PTRGRIYPDVLKPEFINYQDDTFKPWLIQMGKNYDLGIINNIIPNLIWKRNVMQAWAEFCEKFGLPLITATTNTTDPKVLD